MKRKQLMTDHYAMMETKLSRPTGLEDPGRVSIYVVIVVSSLSNLQKYAAFTVLINTIKKKEAIWNYVSMTFTLQQKKHKMQNIGVKGMDTDVGTLATSVSNMAVRNKTSSGQKGSVRCYN